MKVAIISSIVLLLLISETFSMRIKRDVTCATGGHKGCNISCKLRGWKSGECSWNMETAAFNCNCSQERRGIRCNVGGENTCHISCLVLGHTHGVCDAQSNCQCSGENTRLGDLYETVANRLRK